MLQKKISLSLIFLYITFSSIAQKPEIVITSGHAEMITNIAISPDGKLIASHGPDHIIKIWEVSSGKELTTINNKSEDATSEQRIIGMKFSKDSKHLLTLDEDGNIRYWSIAFGKLQFSLKGTAGIGFNSVDIVGEQVVFVNESYTISTKTLHSDEMKSLDGIMGMAIILNPRNKDEAILLGMDMSLSIINLGNKQVVKKLPESNQMTMNSAVSNNGKYFTAVYADNSLKVWNLTTGNLAFKQKFNTHISDVKFHPITNQLVSLSAVSSGQIEQEIKIWDMQIGSPERIIKVTKPFITKFDIGGENGEYLVMNSSGLVANRNIYTIDILDWKSGKLITTLKSRAQNILQLKTGSQSPVLATVGSDLKLRIWNLENQKITSVYPFAQKICSSPDGNLLGIFGLGINNQVGMSMNIIDLNSLEVKAEIPVSQMLFTGLSFADKNTILAGGIDGSITAWDINKKAEIKKLKNGFAGMQIISADKAFKFVATSASGQSGIKIIDAQQNTLTNTISEAHDLMGASDLKFSPDGKYLASCSFDKKVSLWETGSWNKIRDLTDNIGPLSSISYNLLGTQIASSSRGSTVGKTDYAVHVWNTESGQNVCKLLGHTKNVNDVVFYKNGPLLFSGADDGVFKIWNTEQCEEIASCISMGESDYLIVTPDYYYTGSKGALNGVGFKIKGKTDLYPFEQFDLKLNRPDIIAERIGLASNKMIEAYKNAYLKRLSKMDFTEEMLGSEFLLPEVSILNANQIPFKTTNKKLNLTIHAKDNKYSLDRVNVWINDVPIYGTKGLSLRNENLNNYKKEIAIELSSGKNKIQVSVHNQKGGESLKITQNIFYDSPSKKNNLYLVAIGVSDYDNDDFDLTYASKDAQDLISFMKTQSDKYQNINVISYVDKEATAKNILSAKNQLLQSKVDDEVILFVAGHGLLDEKMDYYFGTPNVNFQNPSENGLPYEQLESLLDGIPARKKLMLIDACHSGEIDKEETIVDSTSGEGVIEGKNNNNEQGEVVFRGWKKVSTKKSELGLKNSFELMKELFADLRRGSGAMVISSASGVEFAFESADWKNGVFTYSLLEGLKSKKADLNKDKQIHVSELRDYVMKRVNELTKGQQHPTSRRENLEFDFKVW